MISRLFVRQRSKGPQYVEEEVLVRHLPKDDAAHRPLVHRVPSALLNNSGSPSTSSSPSRVHPRSLSHSQSNSSRRRAAGASTRPPLRSRSRSTQSRTPKISLRATIGSLRRWRHCKSLQPNLNTKRSHGNEWLVRPWRKGVAARLGLASCVAAAAMRGQGPPAAPLPVHELFDWVDFWGDDRILFGDLPSATSIYTRDGRAVQVDTHVENACFKPIKPFAQ